MEGLFFENPENPWLKNIFFAKILPYPMGSNCSIHCKDSLEKDKTKINEIKVDFQNRRLGLDPEFQSWDSIVIKLNPVDFSPGLRHAPPWKYYYVCIVCIYA